MKKFFALFAILFVLFAVAVPASATGLPGYRFNTPAHVTSGAAGFAAYGPGAAGYLSWGSATGTFANTGSVGVTGAVGYSNTTVRITRCHTTFNHTVVGGSFAASGSHSSAMSGMGFSPN